MGSQAAGSNDAKAMSHIDLIAVNRQLRVDLLGEEWLQQEHRSHAGWRQWNLCEQILRQPSQFWNLLRSDGRELVQMLLDSLIWAQLTHGQARMNLGLLESISDERDVLEKIRSRILNSDQYDDLLVELYVAAWYLSKNRHPRLTEESGLPDMQVDAGDLTKMLVECKRVSVVSANRINAIARKASTQIRSGRKRHGSDHYGLAVLDVSAAVGPHEGLTDNPPDQVNAVVDLVRAALSGQKNQSVDTAAVVWDSYRVVSDVKTVFAFTRHVSLVHHDSPRYLRERPTELFEGYTSTLIFPASSRTRPNQSVTPPG